MVDDWQQSRRAIGSVVARGYAPLGPSILKRLGTLQRRLDVRVVGSILFVLVLLLTLWDRWQVLADVALVYTDKDQVLMWTAAYEFLNGRFHEPRFFGQDYNSLMEGLVAVVPAALGLPFQTAVPLATSVLGLAPFVALGVCALRIGCQASASLLVALPLLLPIEYGVISSMPRGFITGIFVASIPACLSLFACGRLSFLASGFLLVISVSINESAVILAAPVAVSLVLAQPRSRAMYLWGGGGALLAGGLHYLSVAFYSWHPTHLVYDARGIWPLDLAALVEGLRNSGRFLGALTPVFPDQEWVLPLLFVLALTGLIAWGSRNNALALMAGLACIVFSFSVLRVHAQGSDSVYFHWARTYLAVPLLLGLGWLWAERAAAGRLSARHKLTVAGAVGVLALASLYGRASALDDLVDHRLQLPNWAGVSPWPVAEIDRRCGALHDAALANDAELVVFRHIHKVVAYACEPLLDQAIQTLLVRDYVPERRTWRLVEESRLRRRRMLLYNFSPAQIAEAAALGVEIERKVDVGKIAVVPVQLPEELDVFAFLGSIRIVHGRALQERVRRLSAE